MSQTGSGFGLRYTIHWVTRRFSWGDVARGVKLTTHLRLGLRLRMNGAIRLLPHVPSWHTGGQVHL